MKHGPLIFLGVFFTLTLSWYGMIVMPQLQLGRALQVPAGPANVRYPSGRPGLAQRGAEVYRANGCHYCHTQQVRPEVAGADLARGWGVRFSVAQDYLTDYPVMLGARRIGPDLANMGARVPEALSLPQTAAADTNQITALREWHLMHLYNSRITSLGSNMPRYPYLFEQVKRRKEAPVTDGALSLPAEFVPKGSEKGDYVFDVVPKREAVALVEYLLSLQAALPLFEAPIPAPEGEGDGDTNQSPATTETNVAPAASTTVAPNQ